MDEVGILLLIGVACLAANGAGLISAIQIKQLSARVADMERLAGVRIGNMRKEPK
jgi:hypothetical protein